MLARVANVEAHITGTVWKIEVAVGDSVEEGDTVVVLESMKMEMPVEAEDDGTVAEIRCAEGQAGLRGRHARRAALVRELAGGKLRLDAPAPHVARFTLANPAKRNALDHDILDALAATLPELEARCLLLTGEGKAFQRGLRPGGARRRGRGLRRGGGRHRRRIPSPPPSRRSTASRCRARRAQRARHRRWPGARAVVRPAHLQRRARLGMPPARLGLVYSHTGLRKFLDALGAAAHA